MKLFSVSPFRSSLTVGLVIRKDGKRTTTWNVSWVDSVLARESSVLGGLRLGHSPLLFWLAEYGPSACFLRILLKLYYMEKVSLDRYRIGSSRNRFVRIVNISWRLEDDELTPTAPTYLYQFRIYISLVGRAINFFSVRLRPLPCGFRRLIPRKPEAVSSTLHISGFLQARSSKLEARGNNADFSCLFQLWHFSPMKFLLLTSPSQEVDRDRKCAQISVWPLFLPGHELEYCNRRPTVRKIARLSLRQLKWLSRANSQAFRDWQHQCRTRPRWSPGKLLEHRLLSSFRGLEVDELIRQLVSCKVFLKLQQSQVASLGSHVDGLWYFLGFWRQTTLGIR